MLFPSQQKKETFSLFEIFFRMINFKNTTSSDKANFYVNGFELAVYAFGTFIYVEQNTWEPNETSKILWSKTGGTGWGMHKIRAPRVKIHHYNSAHFSS